MLSRTTPVSSSLRRKSKVIRDSQCRDRSSLTSSGDARTSVSPYLRRTGVSKNRRDRRKDTHQSKNRNNSFQVFASTEKVPNPPSRLNTTSLGNSPNRSPSSKHV